MLTIEHQGLRVNLDLNTAGFTGDPTVDANLASVQALRGGRAVSIDSAGLVKLQDGLGANGDVHLGFLVNDAAGAAFENRPALSSKKVAAAQGPNVFVSDQIVTGVTFSPRELVYAGTGANVGLLTDTPPAGARPLGVVLRGNTVANPTVRFYAFAPAPL